MNATTAHDMAPDSVNKYARAERAARKLGNQRMVARFERKRMQAERILLEWQRHPALSVTLTREDGRIVSRTQGRRVRSWPEGDLRPMEGWLRDRGFRHFDLTGLGRHA